ncbi:hypothetical protein BP5796_06593 [Coleophoma crateriformis]|uniref:Rhodopsin domain-containing protein n=1 Tax=Coleophoma crateriformis TaxID=565419 RepID=A0A3D8RNU9_9HELO|nr:hypothetical protein BP5796_06593 [Coleophoma crateriformis]
MHRHNIPPSDKILEVSAGLGRRMVDVTPEGMTLYAKSLWISIIFYNTSLLLTKLSLLLGYLRVFPHPRVRLVSKVTMGFILCSGLYWIISTCLLCRPVSFFWDKSIKDGVCINAEPIWLSHAGLNIFTDLAIILIPMPVIRTMNLQLKPRLWLLTVFALGGFITVISIIRLPLLLQIFGAPDLTYTGAGCALASAVESNVAIICASLPPLRSLIRKYAPNLIASSKTTNTSQHAAIIEKFVANTSASGGDSLSLENCLRAETENETTRGLD